MIEFCDNVVMMDPRELVPNPENRGIHPDIDPQGADAEMLASIKAHGVLEPLTIFPDKMICAGHRRRELSIMAGRDQVPVTMLATADKKEAFRATLLARRVSIHAMCVAYREQITDYIRRGNTVKSKNAAKDGVIAHSRKLESEKLEADWVRMETVTGFTRVFLLRGVKLLEALDSLKATGVYENQAHASKVRSTFRNRGLEPARRLFGEKDVEPSDEGEVDCGAWGKDEDEAERPKRKRKPRPMSSDQEPVADIAPEESEAEESPATVAFVARDPDEWRRDVAHHIECLHELADAHGFLKGPVIRAFNTIRVGAGLIEPPSVLRKSA